MEKELILLSEYCEKSKAEPDFILLLEAEGLIETELRDDAKYIKLSQLRDLDMFARLYYDLSINIEGIDVINNLLLQMRQMEKELALLKRQMSSSFFSDDFFDEYI